MTPLSTTHLSEEALDDVLIDLGSAESHAHLAACAECRARVAMFRGDIALFNAASMSWSNSRRLQPLPSEARHHPRLRAAFIGWAATAAALVLMAVGIWRHHPAATPNNANTVQSLPADSEAQIAQDNQLLQAVNAAINPVEASPMDEYKLLGSHHPDSTAHSKTRTK
jgi:anti-sigma factor RsiW